MLPYEYVLINFMNRKCVRLWILDDGTKLVHQLPSEIRCSYSSENNDVRYFSLTPGWRLLTRQLRYKFLNTFIDDLFAFTIKMPTLHRLATLRDDV